ncbi:MAG: hypothetical protein LBU42_10095 [Prevotellaceae bacterium]|jgi:hypothetical protein|nr:hypothetical protein [Prevotellaceae bacterium]
MSPEQTIQNAVLYLPPRNPRGVDVGDVARMFPPEQITKKENTMMNFETGGNEAIYLYPRHRPRYRRTNNALPATDTGTQHTDILPADEQEAYTLAGARAYNAYRQQNRQSRWIRAALFVLLVALIVKILK